VSGHGLRSLLGGFKERKIEGFKGSHRELHPEDITGKGSTAKEKGTAKKKTKDSRNSLGKAVSGPVEVSERKGNDSKDGNRAKQRKGTIRHPCTPETMGRFGLEGLTVMGFLGRKTGGERAEKLGL